MPRPKSLDGKNETVSVKVSESLRDAIDAARGKRSRSDWGRDAFLAALGRQQPILPSASDKTEPAPKNCRHPRVRGKGACPDCYEWVARKP